MSRLTASGIIKIKTLTLALTSTLALTALVAPFAPALASTWWQPTPDQPIHWQWQIGDPFNASADLVAGVTVYDIDGFDTSSATVQYLHSLGCTVIAYFSFGTYENWRPDAAQFPLSVLGNSDGWPGEQYLDIRSQAVRTIMDARLDLAKSKGFDAIEPDNIDGWENNSGFPLTAQDQLNYNEWVASEAHTRGLSVGLKNDIEQITTLEPYFDWDLDEQAYQYSEYSSLSAFTSDKKAVFEVEYGDTTPQADVMNSMHVNSMTRDINLTAPTNSAYIRIPCTPDNQVDWNGAIVTPPTTQGDGNSGGNQRDNAGGNGDNNTPAPPSYVPPVHGGGGGGWNTDNNTAYRWDNWKGTNTKRHHGHRHHDRTGSPGSSTTN